VLYQLSYSHRLADYSNCGWRMSERFPLGRIGFLPGNRRSVFRYEAIPNGVEYMGERGEGQIEQGKREGIKSSRAEMKKTRIRRLALEPRAGGAHPRPTPTYSKPMARSRVESSRFFVSTMMGFFSRCLIRSKSRDRNSGQPVPTTSASMPSAAA
jgi:hypothetical protein